MRALEDLKESTRGVFYQRLAKIVSVIEKSEHRNIQQMLPSALYTEIRNKLDHTNHKYILTKSEAENIYRNVSSFINELFLIN